jgi:hypothetical protein
MSLLPPQAIDEFQQLWQEQYGVEISREEATARAHQLFALFQLLARPLPSEEAARASPPSSDPPPTSTTSSPPL